MIAAESPLKRAWIGLLGALVIIIILAIMAVPSILTRFPARQDTAPAGSSKVTQESAGAMVRLSAAPAKLADQMAWSSDGAVLATAEIDVAVNYPGPPTTTFEVKLWDVSGVKNARNASSNAPTAAIPLLHQTSYINVKALSWSPDGQMLAIGLDRNTIKVLDRSGHERYTLSSPMPNVENPARGSTAEYWASTSFAGYVRGLSWSPDSHMLASASYDPFSIAPFSPDGVFRIWNMQNGTLARAIKVPAEPDAKGNSSFIENGVKVIATWVDDVQWSRDGRMIAAGFLTAVGVWDPITGQRLQRLEGISRREDVDSVVLRFRLSPDSHTVAVMSGGEAYVWDASTGSLLRTILGAVPPTPTSTPTPLPPPAPSPTLDPDRGPSPRFPIPIDSDPGAVSDVAWSPDGNTLAVMDVYQTVVWNARTGKQLYFIPAPSNPLWSSDGQMLASRALAIGDDGYIKMDPIRLWDGVTGKELSTPTNSEAYNLAWSPYGRLLAVSSKKGLEIWGEDTTGR